LIAIALLGLVAAASAYSISRVRTAAPEGWVRLARADPRQVLPFRIALKQRNMDVLERMLLDRADPKSANYANWMTRDEVLDLVAPPKEDLVKVTTWLASQGLRNVDGTGRDVVVASATVEQLERIFGCAFHAFKHVASGKTLVRHFGELAHPAELDNVIEFVSGLSELWEPSHLKTSRRPVDAETAKRNDVSAGYIIPAVLRNMYGLPATFRGENKASICVAEFQDDASYNQQDLTWWNQQVGETTSVSKNVGPFAPQFPDGEATLDTQYAFALALNAQTWFWTVQGWMYEFATALMNTPNPPLVVSMSWGWPEPRQCEVGSCSDSKAYVTRVNSEFMKISAMGVSLVASSGDQGAPGDSNANCNSVATPLSTIFPGASPYVTSVGATMLNPQGTPGSITFNQPACQSFPCSAITSEVVCSYPGALITSGGGFSDYVPRPSWQNTAVTAHLNNPAAKLPPSQYFNKDNRAFPDVAANGHAYLIGISSFGSGTALEQVDGTSASSPVFGATISLINSHRLASGKKPLGFLNPMLYAAPANAFTDITQGNNYATESCTAQYGFTATQGWDPVTGLGTPSWNGLFAYANNLP
jgi:tripeptidyl-peptidase-1